MKSTGIVRRIDDLGRVVIPKEIRRRLLVRENDPLEMFLDGSTLILKKYSPIENIESKARNYCLELARVIDTKCLISDRGNIIFSSYKSSGSDADSLKAVIERVVDSRKGESQYIVENVGTITIVPIFSEGEMIGTFIVIHKDEAPLDESQMKLIQFATTLIGKELEI